MKNQIKQLVVALILVLGAAPAWAQFSQTYVQKYWIEYLSPDPVNFSLTEVAEALETTPEDLANELQLFYEGSGSVVNFQLEGSDGTLYPNETAGYTQGTNGGFWMNTEGDALYWGNDGFAWYNQITWDKDNDTFTILVGQNPNYFINGGTATAKYILTYNEKAVTFEISLVVYPKGEVTAELDINKLNILAEHTIEATQHKRAKAQTYSLSLPKLTTDLGIEADELINHLDIHLFGQYYDAMNETWTDSLTCEYNASPLPGFWFTQTYDEITGELSELCYPGYISSGDFASRFYASSFVLNETADELSVNIGQNGDFCEINSTYKSVVYLVHNTEAYKINLVLKIDEAPAFDISTLEFAGESFYETTIKKKDDTGTEFSIPLDSIAELISVPTDELTYLALDRNDQLTNNSTANFGGFWFDINSRVCAFQDPDFSMYVEPVSATDMSKVYVGQWQAFRLQPGESQTSQLYLLGESKYYVLNFTLNIEAEVVIDSVDKAEWIVVDTLSYDVTISQPEGYVQSQTTQIDWDAVLEALELETIDEESFFTWNEPTNGTWDATYLTKNYSCGPYPGFWMDETGSLRSEWGTHCAYGVTLAPATGVLTWYVHPDAGHMTGETYLGEFFIVNAANGKVVQINTNITFNNERVSFTTVGETDINLELNEENADSYDTYIIPFDLIEIIRALGLEYEEDYDFCKWYVQNPEGEWQYVEYFGGGDCTFSADGYAVDWDDENCTFALGYDNYDKVFFFTNLLGDSDSSTLYTTKLAIGYENKAYILTVRIGSDKAISIDSVKVEDKNNVIYRIDGTKANKETAPAGIYIIGGKKVVIRN